MASLSRRYLQRQIIGQTQAKVPSVWNRMHDPSKIVGDLMEGTLPSRRREDVPTPSAGRGPFPRALVSDRGSVQTHSGTPPRDSTLYCVGFDVTCSPSPCHNRSCPHHCRLDMKHEKNILTITPEWWF